MISSISFFVLNFNGLSLMLLVNNVKEQEKKYMINLEKKNVNKLFVHWLNKLFVFFAPSPNRRV